MPWSENVRKNNKFQNNNKDTLLDNTYVQYLSNNIIL